WASWADAVNDPDTMPKSSPTTASVATSTRGCRRVRVGVGVVWLVIGDPWVGVVGALVRSGPDHNCASTGYESAVMVSTAVYVPGAVSTGRRRSRSAPRRAAP